MNRRLNVWKLIKILAWSQVSYDIHTHFIAAFKGQRCQCSIFLFSVMSHVFVFSIFQNSYHCVDTDLSCWMRHVCKIMLLSGWGMLLLFKIMHLKCTHMSEVPFCWSLFSTHSFWAKNNTNRLSLSIWIFSYNFRHSWW